MESVLVLLCMIFFIILIRGFIAGVNLNKNNLIKCRRIYVPQDINLETAFNSLINKNLDGLKKRARELGATKKYIDELDNELNNELNTEIDKENKLKKFIEFIVLNSISDGHILFESIEGTIDDIVKEQLLLNDDKIKLKIRITQEINNMSDKQKQDLANELHSSVETPQLVDSLLETYELNAPFTDPTISVERIQEEYIY